MSPYSSNISIMTMLNILDKVYIFSLIALIMIQSQNLKNRQEKYKIERNKNNEPLKPKDMFNSLLLYDIAKDKCIQSSQSTQNILRKETLKKEISTLLKNKNQFIALITRRKQLKQTLTELLNYRQSIDYDHKFKRLKLDHYNFPYKSNINLKQQLNSQRIQNIQKRRRIRQLQQQLNLKQKSIKAARSSLQNTILHNIQHLPAQRDNPQIKQDLFWNNKINTIKSRYLNSEEKYRRQKIKHDYNIMIQKSGCECYRPACTICSVQTWQKKDNRYRQALLSPRYTRIYRK